MMNHGSIHPVSFAEKHPQKNDASNSMLYTQCADLGVVLILLLPKAGSGF